MQSLEGKTMLITGAAGPLSIGRATAVSASSAGAKVAINDLPDKESLARELADEITALGGHALTLLGDVTDVATTRRLIDSAVEGLGSLDILVNNAGGGHAIDFLDVTEEDFDHQLNVNLKSAFFLSQAAARHMLERGSGIIINLASDLSYVGHPTWVPYSAAKSGIRALTKSLALALAPRVTVIAVAPGPTDTPLIHDTYETSAAFIDSLPLKRICTPEDIARTVVWLAGDDGGAFTGQTLNPNCGAVMV